MSMMQGELPDARVVDLFAGSGGLGLEALSRGARHTTFVERAGGALRTLRRNIAKLGAGDATTVIRADALAWTASLGPDAFDLALADPPYDSGAAEALVRTFERTRFAPTLWIEHRVSDALPELEGSDTRRYGDTLLTRFTAPR